VQFIPTRALAGHSNNSRRRVASRWAPERTADTRAGHRRIGSASMTTHAGQPTGTYIAAAWSNDASTAMVAPAMVTSGVGMTCGSPACTHCPS